MKNSDGAKRGNYRHKEDYIEDLMRVLKYHQWQSTAELMRLLGIEKRHVFIHRYIMPAYDAGLVEFFLKHVPSNRNQLYKKTQDAAVRFGI